MILLLSRLEGEATTEHLIDWLDYLGGNYTRINGDDLENGDLWWSINSAAASSEFNIEGKTINIDSVKIVWYRRWSFKNQSLSLNGDTEMVNHLTKHRRQEFLTLSRSFFSTLSNKFWISRPKSFGKREQNKLETLKIASRVGLDIPNSLVTTKKDRLLLFFLENDKQIITKPLSEALHFKLNDKSYSTYTALIKTEEFKLFPETFFPSYFQECLQKEIEIRVFYWFGKCYSMAIFSSLDEQTSVDFRRYNYKKPNRNVPYKVPLKIEQLIVELMSELEYKNGSIDLIKTTDGRYVFLEINPVGQFGMVSYPCKYNLEMIVAQKLIKVDES